MSQPLPFTLTPEEIARYDEIEYRKQKGEERDYLKDGQPIDVRHAHYLQWKNGQKKAASPGSSTRPQYQNPSAGSPQACSPASSPEYSVASVEDYAFSNNGSSPPTQQLWSPSGYTGDSNGFSSSPGHATQERPSHVNTAIARLENNQRQILMHSKSCGWKGLLGTLDTGCEENWISEKVVDRLGLQKKKGQVLRYKVFDGVKISSDSKVTATWCVDGQTISHQATFRVVSKKAPFDVLFGRNIQASGEVNFDSEENSIQVLVGPAETQNEQQEMERNEAAAQAERARLMSTPQHVKKSDKGSSAKRRKTEKTGERQGEKQSGSNRR